jgi:hypothetical protein
MNLEELKKNIYADLGLPLKDSEYKMIGVEEVAYIIDKRFKEVERWKNIVINAERLKNIMENMLVVNIMVLVVGCVKRVLKNSEKVERWVINVKLVGGTLFVKKQRLLVTSYKVLICDGMRVLIIEEEKAMITKSQYMELLLLIADKMKEYADYGYVSEHIEHIKTLSELLIDLQEVTEEWKVLKVDVRCFVLIYTQKKKSLK